MDLSIEAIRAAHDRIRPHIQNTPCELSETLSAQLGCQLFLKFENLQFTASFKERGALNCLLNLGEQAQAGVIAMSAGNHAQALAYHGQRLAIPTTIVMPRSTPNAKVEATRVFGAQVHMEGSEFDETLQYTQALAQSRQLQLVHPFDDAHVVAGQGTVALEILQQVPDLDVILVPVGGGGLIGGVAVAVKALRPEVQVIGVQMQRFPGAYALKHNKPGAPLETGATVAEGIAVKVPGEITGQLIQRYVDDILLVSEAQVEQAIFDLLEIEKTVVEGAGATPLALVRSERARFAGKKVAAIVSGGNIDMMILSSVLQRGLVRSHRLVRLRVEIPDLPGSLAALTSLLGQLDSNIVDIEHHRAFAGSSVRATVVELLLQMRGEEQEETVARALAEAGYAIID